ncbi:ApaLI-like restriction endonuclease [Candidatus Hepatincola sp. Pdp]
MSLEQSIYELVKVYRRKLHEQIDLRIENMSLDSNDHHLIYKVLGISCQEGKLIDEYQNKGRFLYKYAGSLLEELTILCFKDKFYDSKIKLKIDNTIGVKPKKFEIDCVVNNKAYEIKWRDATTDGDHITKEHTRIKVIKEHGYIPIRIMYYYPNRSQAIKIQETLETLYKGIGGEYYSGDIAWDYVYKTTDINLFKILKGMAN